MIYYHFIIMHMYYSTKYTGTILEFEHHELTKTLENSEQLLISLRSTHQAVLAVQRKN